MNWRLLFFSYASLICFGLIDNSRGPLYPDLLKDLSLLPKQGAWLFALASFSSLLVNLTTSWWIHKKLGITWMRLGLFFMGLGSFLLGIAGISKNLPLLWLSSITFGFGTGLTGMMMNIFVTEASPSYLRRRAYGVLHGLYGVSSLLAPPLFSFWFLFYDSWTSFFQIITVLPISILIGSFLFIKKEKKIETKEINQDSSKRKDNPSLKTKIHWAITMGLYVACEIVVSSRLIFFLRDSQGIEASLAGKYLSAFFACLMTGRLALGFVSLPFSGQALIKGSLIASIIALTLGQAGFLWAFPLSGLTMSIIFPSAMDIIGEEYRENLAIMTAAIMSGTGFFVAAMHLGFGQMATLVGTKGAMALAPTLAILSLVGILTLPRPNKEN